MRASLDVIELQVNLLLRIRARYRKENTLPADASEAFLDFVSFAEFLPIFIYIVH